MASLKRKSKSQRVNHLRNRPRTTPSRTRTEKALVAEIIDSVGVRERKVQGAQDRRYSLRVGRCAKSGSKAGDGGLGLADIEADKGSELKRSEIRYRRFFEEAPDGILILDSMSRKIIDANQFIVDFLGYSREELLGKELWQIGLLKDEKASRTAMSKLERQNFIRYQVPLQTKTGERREVEVTVKLYDEAGYNVIQCNIRDFAEGKEADRVKTRLATIVESSEDAIVGKDLNGVITDWNRGAERLFGYTAQEAIGHSVTMLIPPEHADEEKRILGRIRRGESVEHFETVRRRKDGTQIDISLTVSPITDAKGRIVGASKIARDITERKQASEALRRALQFDEAIMRNMGEGLYTLDSEGRVTSMNPAAEKLLGWTLYELRGKKLHDVMHYKHRDGTPFPEEECPKLRACREGKTLSAHEDCFIRKNGTFFDVVYSASPIWDGDKVTGQVVVFHDVTERKRAEATLREARKRLANQAAQLERLVEERTAELAASNKQLETFVYTIAHDLRAPLRAMQGFAEMLAEEANTTLSETGRSFVERIGKSARFMDLLLVDLLAFSRIGQERMEMVSVDLEGVVGGVVSRLENEAKEKKGRIEVLGPWPRVMAHAPALGQVLFNLVSNSLKFVAPGVPPMVRLRTEERAGWVRVWVEDNGIGIAPEYHDQIFRVFNRLHGEKYPGTGMGLAIVQRAVERMGGRAGLESGLGQGSRFWIELRKA